MYFYHTDAIIKLVQSDLWYEHQPTKCMVWCTISTVCSVTTPAV